MQTPTTSTRDLAARYAVASVPKPQECAATDDVYAEAHQTRRALERISREMQQRVADCFGEQPTRQSRKA